jgi:cell shape-determining protein MreC
MNKRWIAPLALTFTMVATSGCISTVKTVVTAPFKVVGQTADWATTSQDGADRNRGRRDRKAEKREAKERREQEKRDRREYDR